MTTLGRQRIEGYTRFIRPYAYYNILVDYGPPILVGDEVINTNESMEYYDRPRSTYDEAMEYTCGELEKAAQLMPPDVGLQNFGSTTKGAEFSRLSRLRQVNDSTVYNGGEAKS